MKLIFLKGYYLGIYPKVGLNQIFALMESMWLELAIIEPMEGLLCMTTSLIHNHII